MARRFRQSSVAVNAAVNAICRLLDGGFLRIYSGSQPDSAEDGLRQTTELLVEMRWGSPAFKSSVDGAAQSLPIISGKPSVAAGKASFFRALAKDGATVIFDGSVGETQADMIFPDVRIQHGALVKVESFRFTLPRSVID